MTHHRVDRRTFLKFAMAGTTAMLAPALLSSRRSAVSAAPEPLDALLEPIRAAHGIPALAGAFVRGSDLVALGAVGVRVLGMPEHVQPADRFHLGSCTKSMTATLLAVLVEAGKLTWEATVGDVFADLRLKIHPGYHRVTLRQLLSHRGGLPDDRTPDPTIQPQVRALSGPIIQQRRDYVALVLARAPASEPGTRMVYSNAGYVIAGAFAEQVTNQEWEALMRSMLFQPLGMASAGFGPPGVSQPWGHTQSGCQPVSPGPEADNPLVIGPAGTVHSSVADWGRYAALHLRGARGESGLLLRPESFAHLHRDAFRQEYALGWGLAQRSWAGGLALTHGGTNTLWWAVIWLAPARNAAFLAAVNCGAESGFRACDSAVGAMIRRFL